jgi:hypothetical protein
MQKEHQGKRSIIAAALIAALVVAVSVGGAIVGRHADADPAIRTSHAHMGHEIGAPASLEFHDGMRQLWEDHVTWTRLFIVSFVHDLPDLDATTGRLLRNQVDIGDAIKPYYGEAAGERLTTLLSEHITTAASLLGAAKHGDQDAFRVANDAWYRNARQISRFLHRANPVNWPLREMNTMMRDHLDLTLAEAVARLEGDYGREIAGYDAVHAEILQMADMLSDGIVQQFPEKF